MPRAANHSDKALTTLTAMGTTPDMWAFAEIVWTEELRTVRAKVRCDACKGAGKTGPWSAPVRCDVCYVPRTRRASFNQGMGVVFAMVEKLVMVGRPVWPQGVKFDSRYHASCMCGLCGKTVLKSNLIPVVGGQHGMWVGADCAKKFMPAVKAPKMAEDALLEVSPE